MSNKHKAKREQKLSRQKGTVYYAEKFAGKSPEELAREIALENLRNRVEIGSSIAPTPTPKPRRRPPQEHQLKLFLPKVSTPPAPLEELATETEFEQALQAAFAAGRTCFTAEALEMLLAVGEQPLITARNFRARAL